MQAKLGHSRKTIKELSKDAISLALEGEWEKAAEINRLILDMTPADVEAMNRLGKALMEMGQYGEAKGILERVVQAAPYNNIAKKNLARVAQLESEPQPAKAGRRAAGAGKFFIEDSGSSGATVLQRPAQARVLSGIAPGDPLTLKVENSHLSVYVQDGEYLGRVEPKLGRRLIKLMDGGNRYEAAVIAVKEEGISVILRESYRHPNLRKVSSFPTRNNDESRHYIAENVLRYLEEVDLDEDNEEDGDGVADEPLDDSDWEE